jgi:hypothetical protein
MAQLRNIDAESGANFIGDDVTPTLSFANTVGPALEVVAATAGNASISGLKLTSSTASAPVMQLGGTSFVSAVTIKFITGGVAGTGAIRIALTDGTFGWIPVLPDAAVTAAAKA